MVSPSSRRDYRRPVILRDRQTLTYQSGEGAGFGDREDEDRRLVRHVLEGCRADVVRSSVERQRVHRTKSTVPDPIRQGRQQALSGSRSTAFVDVVVRAHRYGREPFFSPLYMRRSLYRAHASDKVDKPNAESLTMALSGDGGVRQSVLARPFGSKTSCQPLALQGARRRRYWGEGKGGYVATWAKNRSCAIFESLGVVLPSHARAGGSADCWRAYRLARHDRMNLLAPDRPIAAETGIEHCFNCNPHWS